MVKPEDKNKIKLLYDKLTKETNSREQKSSIRELYIQLNSIFHLSLQE